jgi:CspA family cold shock protein
METGTVKFFNDSKGWGFITRENSEQIFVHYSGLQGKGYRTLTNGEAVSFDVQSSERGPVAINVIRLNPPAETKPQTIRYKREI